MLDRAAIHTGGPNTNLEDWLWDNFCMFCCFFFARAPEWDPLELVGNIMVQCLNMLPQEWQLKRGSIPLFKLQK